MAGEWDQGRPCAVILVTYQGMGYSVQVSSQFSAIRVW
jgi:hypothetical protein